MPAKSLTNIERAVEAIERTIAPSIAGIQPSTWNPETNNVVILRTIALTININNPNVSNVSGSVSNTNTGLINVLITPRTIAASNADVKDETLIPGTIYAVIIKARVLSNSEISSAIEIIIDM